MKLYEKSIIFLVGVLFPMLAYGSSTSCADSELTVQSEKETLVEHICSIVKVGRNILDSMGLTLPKHLTITVSHTLPDNNLCQLKCFGVFDTKTGEISLLDYDSASRLAQKSPLFINEKMRPELWDSYVIHELAHASVQNTTRPETSLRIISEYIASVAQMESLSSIEREKILNDYKDLNGFERHEEINMTYYLIDPGKFIVKAYRHYHSQENGPSFVKQILRDGLSCQTP